jgi:ActR/RegA family two-component response regulator
VIAELEVEERKSGPPSRPLQDGSASKTLGTALIVAQDAATIRMLTEAMRPLPLAVDVRSVLATALDRIHHHKVEVGVVDFLVGDQAELFLRGMRASTSNRSAVTFAVTANCEETAHALRAGSHFALERPLSVESIRRTVGAAQGLIVRELRRYFRYSISVPAVLSGKGMAETFGRTENVSEGGVAFWSSTSLVPAGREVTVEFTLPNPPFTLRARCKVRWSNEKGQAGLSFLFLPVSLRMQLQAWLAQTIEEMRSDPLHFATL